MSLRPRLPRMATRGVRQRKEANLEPTTSIYVGIALAACAIALAGRSLLRRGSRTRSSASRNLLNTIIAQQSAGSRYPAPVASGLSRRVAGAARPAQGGPELAALERHLRTAILDPNARERLVKDAMRKTGGGRAAAIRKVLRDLHDQDKRWS